MSTPAAVQVLLDLRDRWLERGVDWWSEDPTSRPGDGWVRVDELAADTDRIERLVTAWQESHGIDGRKAAASLLVKRRGSIIAFPPTVAWMNWRRVPTLRPDGVWLRLQEGEPRRLAVPDPEAAVLPDDPLADAEGIQVLGEDSCSSTSTPPRTTPRWAP